MGIYLSLTLRRHLASTMSAIFFSSLALHQPLVRFFRSGLHRFPLLLEILQILRGSEREIAGEWRAAPCPTVPWS